MRIGKCKECNTEMILLNQYFGKLKVKYCGECRKTKANF